MRRKLTALAFAAAATSANAGDTAGGFKGPDATRVATVAEASALADDAPVRLEGHIIRAVGDEKYELQDDSGTLVVEIDDEDWGGLEVTPSDRVELSGEIVKEWNEVELDVERIRRVE
jgi:uncharacterized protein (TIGR00156 family)